MSPKIIQSLFQKCDPEIQAYCLAEGIFSGLDQSNIRWFGTNRVGRMLGSSGSKIKARLEILGLVKYNAKYRAYVPTKLAQVFHLAKICESNNTKLSRIYNTDACFLWNSQALCCVLAPYAITPGFKVKNTAVNGRDGARKLLDEALSNIRIKAGLAMAESDRLMSEHVDENEAAVNREMMDRNYVSVPMSCFWHECSTKADAVNFLVICVENSLSIWSRSTSSQRKEMASDLENLEKLLRWAKRLPVGNDRSLNKDVLKLSRLAMKSLTQKMRETTL